MKLNRVVPLFAVFFLWVGSNSILAVDINLTKFVVNSTPVSDEQQLVELSEIIVYGQFEAEMEEYHTEEKVEGGELVNYVQLFKVLKAIKGKPPEDIIRIVSTGIDPLPKPRDPINMKYPGPMAEGEYVIFLRSVPDTDMYTIIGGWQGVYPIFEGKLISLEAYGFPNFLNLTIKQLERKISSIQ